VAVPVYLTCLSYKAVVSLASRPPRHSNIREDYAGDDPAGPRRISLHLVSFPRPLPLCHPLCPRRASPSASTPDNPLPACWTAPLGVMRAPSCARMRSCRRARAPTRAARASVQTRTRCHAPARPVRPHALVCSLRADPDVTGTLFLLGPCPMPASRPLISPSPSALCRARPLDNVEPRRPARVARAPSRGSARADVARDRVTDLDALVGELAHSTAWPAHPGEAIQRRRRAPATSASVRPVSTRRLSRPPAFALARQRSRSPAGVLARRRWRSPAVALARFRSRCPAWTGRGRPPAWSRFYDVVHVGRRSHPPTFSFADVRPRRRSSSPTFGLGIVWARAPVPAPTSLLARRRVGGLCRTSSYALARVRPRCAPSFARAVCGVSR
jgi:hypothetical protein